MSSDVLKCPKDWFSVRETCRENKDMVCGGRAKKPARAQREDYAEQRELKLRGEKRSVSICDRPENT